MRRSPSFTITPGGAILLGALVFLLQPAETGALAAAVGVHELGHLLALLLLGVRLDGIALTATGPVLCCMMPEQGAEGALATVSGPAFGALFWLSFRRLWPLAAEMSSVLTVVNLLPVLPLDGGRLLKAFTASHVGILRAVRFVVLVLLFSTGFICLYLGYGLAPLLFALWLLVLPNEASHSCKKLRNAVK